MNKSTDKKLKATVFAAALKATDAEDIQACKTDMQKFAELSEDEATIVANAIRSKQIPAMAKRAGLDEEFVGEMISPTDNDVVDFAAKKETKPVEEELDDDILDTEEDDTEDDGLDMSDEDEGPEFDDTDLEDYPDDMDEVDDEDSTATINIEVPANMLDEVKEKLEAFFAETFSNVASEDDFESSDFDDTEIGEDTDIDNFDDIDDEVGENSEPITRRDEMEKQTPEDMPQELAEKLAQRKAYRQQLLTRVAASEDNIKPKDIGLGKDTSFGGKPYQFSEKLQHEDEIEYPKMTMEDSGGNSLKDDPGFIKITVPTKNPESLQLSGSYDVFNFEGGDNGTLGFSADFEAMNQIPSGGETATDDNFEIPTQMEQKKRNTTVAKIVTCQGCDNPGQEEVDAVECTDCGSRLCLCSVCQDEGYCPSCAAKQVTAAKEEDKNDKDDEDEVTMAQTENPTVKELKGILSEEEAIPSDQREVPGVELKNVSEVYNARLKTAYAVATQLVLAKIIDPEEVETQVELWINDGLSAKAMKSQGMLMLRSAQSASERIAASAAKATRTASVNSVSTNPSFVANSTTNSNMDLKDALSSIFMERFAE